MQEKTWQTIEYQISQHFACVLEYGDYSGITEEEEKEFNEFLENEQIGIGHWSIEDMSENYGTCEVTGLLSSLMVVHWNYRNE